MNNILKKISFSFCANIFSMFVSMLMILVLPKIMTMEDYGIWQLFMFYFSYVGFFHFGWIDGIYLRYGGQNFSALSRKTFGGQFWLLLILLLVEFAIVNILLISGIIKNSILIFVLRVSSIAGVFYIIFAYVNFILQLSDKIKEYARNIILERFLILLLTLICITLIETKYDKVIYVTIMSEFLAMSFGLYTIRDLIFVERDTFYNAMNEAYFNISAGSKLMLANIAGMLILGIIRFGISQEWDIVTFGKVSLTLNISNFLMVFISAVSIVLFPILKRINQDRLAEIYVLLRNILSYSLLAMLITYYPLKILLLYWLPKYSDSLVYMGLLLPICVFESKLQMLVNTYLKSLRQEALMLKINFISVIFALFMTYVTVVLLHNLKLAILSIVINFAFRLLLAEYFIEKLLSLKLRKDFIEELIVVSSFIFINVHESTYGILIYLAVYLIYALINKKQIKETVKKIRCELAK